MQLSLRTIAGILCSTLCITPAYSQKLDCSGAAENSAYVVDIEEGTVYERFGLVPSLYSKTTKGYFIEVSHDPRALFISNHTYVDEYIGTHTRWIVLKTDDNSIILLTSVTWLDENGRPKYVSESHANLQAAPPWTPGVWVSNCNEVE